MKHERISTRQRVNLLLDRDTVAEARHLGINISEIANSGLRAEVKRARGERWKAENAQALAASAAWVEEHGLPLGDLRVF